MSPSFLLGFLLLQGYRARCESCPHHIPVLQKYTEWRGPSWWAGCSGGASLQVLSSSIRALPSARTEHLWGQQHGPVPSLSLPSLRYTVVTSASLLDSLHSLMGPNFWTTAFILSSVPTPLVMRSPFCPPRYFWVTPPFLAAWVIHEVLSLPLNIR